MSDHEYKVGDLITYRTFDGSNRVVQVTRRHENIKNGKPGFGGTISLIGPELGEVVWGYDEQIVGVGVWPA